MKTLIAIAALCLAGLQEGKKDPAMDLLKGMAGDWESEDKAAKVSTKVTAAGSAVQETLIHALSGDMVTMYHREGEALVMTHYCAAGNQPKMRAAKQEKPDVLKFTCLGINAIDCKKDLHMHALTMTFTGKDQVKQEWSMMKDGKEAMIVTFNLRRK